LTDQVRIPHSTLKQVKLFISMREKGQFSKGMIMEFVNEAVLERLITERKTADLQNGDSTHAQFPSNDKVMRLKNKIMNYLKNKYRFESFEDVKIAKPMLVEAIIAVEGVSDKRSVSDRIILLKINCIKESEDSDKLNKRYMFIPDVKYSNKEQQ
jgi:hypothetical protein